MDELARLYDQAHRPVVFIEYSTGEPRGNRIDRWYGARDPDHGCGLPVVLVDSGWRWTCGAENFQSAYAGLVDQALANPAGADVSGRYTRSGNDLDVSIQIVNRSGKTLGPGNHATATVIVFERTRVYNTGRYARAAVDGLLTSDLPHAGETTYRLQLANVPVAQWDRAVVVVLLEYRPDPGSERYESLQAAIAVELSPTPATPRSSPTPAFPPSPTPTADPSARPLFLPVTARMPPTSGAAR